MESNSVRKKSPHKFITQPSNLLAVLIIADFFISGIMTLHNYGVTWDEGLGNLFFGERYFRYFTSFTEKYLDYNADLKSLSTYPLHLYLFPFHDRPNEFPPLADTLSAASMYLFSYWLKWLNPVDAFHLFTMILAAIFLFVFYRFAAKRLGTFAAIMALLFLGTYPRFWGDMHFNVKDVPEMIFFSLVIITYWTWYENPSWRKSLLAGLLMGCALSVKANAIFILPILLASIFPWSFDRASLRNFIQHFKKYYGHYLLMAGSSILLYVFSWPYLYSNTIARLKSYWLYIWSQGGRAASGWNIEPLREVLTTMPELILLVSVIGLILVIRQAWREKSPFWRLLLFWAAVPIFRASLPGAVNFDGIRHFLEFLPAIALVAGFGVSQAADFISNKLHFRKVLAQIFIVVLFGGSLVQVYSTYYPYLHLYYNEITGGFIGARDKFLGSEATDYWAGSYRQGMDWLNENAPRDSQVFTAIAPWVVNLSGSVFLRPDIKVLSQLPDFSLIEQAPTPVYVMFITRNGGEAQDEIDYTKQHARLVYQIIVDQVPILDIYQYGGK